MAEELLEQGERDERLYEVLLRYLEDSDSGLRPDAKEMLDRHPEFAADLKEFLAAEEQVEHLAAPLREVAKSVLQNTIHAGETPDLNLDESALRAKGVRRLWRWL